MSYLVFSQTPDEHNDALSIRFKLKVHLIRHKKCRGIADPNTVKSGTDVSLHYAAAFSAGGFDGPGFRPGTVVMGDFFCDG